MAKELELKLKEGDAAPGFTAATSGGGTISLDELKGKSVILYFYPKDDTSGCTTEACDFRDNMARVRRSGAAVVGVSADSVKSHSKFAEKFDLPFPLISDEEKRMLKAYGVWKKKSFMGRTFMGIVRTTFVLDERGVIVKIFPKVKVAGHVDEVLEVLKG